MIIDLTSLLVGVLAGSTATGFGILIGAAVRNRRPPLSVCSCEHGAGSHDSATGHCQAQIKRPAKWDTGGNVQGYEWVPCPCLNNDGPELLSVITARLQQPLPRADS